MQTVMIEGNNIRNCISLARSKVFKLKAKDCRVKILNPMDEDRGNYRVTMTTGDVIEIHIIPRSSCKIILVH